MQRETELTTEKTRTEDSAQAVDPIYPDEEPATGSESDSSSTGRPVEDDAGLVFVSYEGKNDPANPYNWSLCKRTYIVFVGTLMSINSTMGSSTTSNMMPALQKTFNVPSGPQTILPATTYLVGFVLGPVVFAPLSEQYGRTPILTWTLFFYILSTMAAALSPDWACFLVFRFLSGTFAGPPMSVSGGSIADCFSDKVVRGRANMLWSAATLLGPLAGPVLSGYTYPYGWRWPFWASMMLSGVCFVTVILQPETLATKILRDKAAKLNKEQHCDKYIAPADKERLGLLTTLKITTTRPLHLLFTEMIVSLTCVYMAFVYAVFYMLLEIFPSVFEGIYGFSAGESGVAFIMMFVGAFISNVMAWYYDGWAATVLIKRHPGKEAEYLRLPLACCGGPSFVLALLWLGWASNKSIPWIVPLLSMIPYGLAYQLIFMAMINYIADAYGIYASSALAACAATRSIAGAVIPLAINSMLDRLGINWSCTVLAFISCGLSLVPFGFIVWGPTIRARSTFSKKLHQHAELELTRSLSIV